MTSELEEFLKELKEWFPAGSDWRHRTTLLVDRAIAIVKRQQEALEEMAKPHLSRRATYELDRRSDFCDEVIADVNRIAAGKGPA